MRAARRPAARRLAAQRAERRGVAQRVKRRGVAQRVERRANRALIRRLGHGKYNINGGSTFINNFSLPPNVFLLDFVTVLRSVY